MALRSLLDRYKSFKRPSLGAGTSSTFSSLAKKQLAAEDAIYDNQYEAGNLSPERYLSVLAERTARPTNTPLQVVTLKEKIGNVQQAVNDASVDRGYQSGIYTTQQVKDYEKAKLDKMTETGSQAYIKQQQKVQTLTDKAEKEARNSFRIQENKRLSTMPDDTSANMYAKAQQYEKLANQARIDGDAQQADVFETQKNNYLNSAKKADVNDLITSTKLSVSQTPDQGLGVPSAEAGANFYSRLLGGSGSNTTGGATAEGGGANPAPSAVTTGFSGFQTPAVKNALESLDRSSKVLDRYYQQKQDNTSYISAYQNAVNQATGDQKTQLTIQLNNYLQRDKELDNSIANVTQGIQDTVVRIQEAQAKAAASAFSQEVRANNLQFTKVENDLETEFARGKITKDEYIQKGVMLAATKSQFYGEVSNAFSQYGNDSSAESYMQKADDMQRIHEQLTGVAQNIDDYESVAVDPGGKLTNLLGKSIKPGDVTLTNVRQLKDAGTWDSNYANINGVYHQVHYPGEILDSNGLPLSSAFSKEVNRNDAFVYNSNAEGGKELVRQVQFLDQNNKPITKILPQTEIDKGIKSNFLIEDKVKGLRQKVGADFTKEALPNGILSAIDLNPMTNTTAKPVIDMAKNVADQILKIASPAYRKSKGMEEPNINLGDAVRKGGDFVKSAISSFTNKPLVTQDSLAGKAISGVQGLFEKAKKGAQAMNPFNPPTVMADEKKMKLDATNESSIKLIAQVFGDKAQEAYRVLPGENSNLNPLAENYNEDGSVDRGVFQINENTFADFMRRKGNLLIQNGIRTFEDMYDAAKNIKMAKIIHDEQGWNAWYGAPADLRSSAKAVAAKAKAGVPTITPSTPGEKKPAITYSGEDLRPYLDPNKVTNAPKPSATPKPNYITSNGLISPQPVKDAPPNPVIQGIRNVASAVQNWQPPKISIPQFSLPTPKVNTPYYNTMNTLANVQKAIQNPVQTVKNTVSNVASNIGNVLKKFKFW